MDTRRKSTWMNRLATWSLVGIPVTYVIMVLVLPLFVIGLYSLNIMSNSHDGLIEPSFSLWKAFLTDPDNPFRARLWRSLGVTAIVSVACVVFAYPIAYFLAFAAGRYRYTLLLAIMLPFFTSYLLRIIAWQGILSGNGVMNSLLRALGLLAQDESISWLIYSNFAVVITLFYSWMPFVILPIFAILHTINTEIMEAAHDLGSNKLSAFVNVLLPLSWPGIAAGFVFVLIPVTGEFVAPLLIGGSNSQLFGNSIQYFFQNTSNWSYGSVLAIALCAIVVIQLAIFGKYLIPEDNDE